MANEMITRKSVLLAVTVGVAVFLVVLLFNQFQVPFGIATGAQIYNTASAAPQEEMVVSKENTVPSKTSRLNWNKRFKFVPNNVENCIELFGGTVNTLPPPLQEKLDGYMKVYENVTSSLKIGIKYIEGYTAQIPVAYRAYVEIASHPSVKTICETGFNGGHSTFSWLTNNPKAQVYSFDLGFHVYAKPMADYIKTLYPDRFHVTWGDSKKTLPEFHRKNPNVTCDVIIIDGGHKTPICKSDFVNFKQMASLDNVVILDNYPQKGWGFMKKLGDCWEWAKRNAQVAEVFNCYVPGPGNADFGFSVGRMTNN